MLNKFFIILGIGLVVVLGMLLSIGFSSEENLSSRLEFEKAIEFVKQEKPTPPVAAIFYAKVSENIYNGTTTDFRKTLDEILLTEKNLPKVEVKVGNDRNEYWVKSDIENPKTPFSPKISQYPRFNLKNFDYVTPPPPLYMSDEYKQELQKVIDTAESRTLEQGAIVNFFGGIPGTETPAGIWQNILWEQVKRHNNKYFSKKITNQEYARIQMLLAQSTADSFMECWKVKYQYQTKRPDMATSVLGLDINLAMPNPPFPSYVSGHATISFTAATVLAHIFPDRANYFLQQAENAKNSRLWAGIHFDYDNEEGKKLGIEIGEYYVHNVLRF